MSNSDGTLNLDEVMASIREAAAKKRAHVGSPLPRTAAFTPARPQDLSSFTKTLNLSPTFVLRSDDHYHVNDLLKYHDRDFVRHSYRAILKREPDEKGLLHHIDLLRSGVSNKIDVLAGLRYSTEGDNLGVKIDGLRLPSLVRKVERLPVVGYVVQLLIGIVRLPTLIKNERQFQNYLIGQQLQIVDHLNRTQSDTARRLEKHAADLNASIHAKFSDLKDLIQEKDERVSELFDRLKHVSQVVDHLYNNPVLKSATLSPDELSEWESLYSTFEDQFRGEPQLVTERLKFYLPFIRTFAPASAIIDLGCGRGDWLELLRQEGFKGRGVESNSVAVTRCQNNGLDVVQADVLEYLKKVPEKSLSVITAFHLIEHLGWHEIIRLIDEIKRTLEPGGLFIMETPNPENLVVAACNFHSDPTHRQPIYPHTMKFVLAEKGFVDLRLHFLNSAEGSPFAKDMAGAEELKMWLFGPLDFALIGRNN